MIMTADLEGEELDETFQNASDEVTELPSRPEQDTLLELYALYKQGTEGDVKGDRPGMLSFKKRAKYDAWADLEGKPSDEAKRDYINLVEELKEEQGI
jgi:acyl-CoA-binding protein